MLAAFSGLFAIVVIIVIGYVIGGSTHFPATTQTTLAQLAFYVGSPAMMLTLLIDAPLAEVFSWHLLAFLIAGLGAAGLTLILTWRRLANTATRVIGAMCGGYVNAGNMGLPIAFYLLGDAAWAAPIMLLQVGALQPIGVAILDAAANTQPSRRWVDWIWLGLRNPITLAALVGIAINLTGIPVPALLLDPVELLAGLAIPLMLIIFGLSLRHNGIPRLTRLKFESLVASIAKLIVMPALAWLAGLALHLTHEQLAAVVVFAALPTAQMVLVHAIRNDSGTTLARETIFTSTLGSVVVLPAIMVLLG